MANNVRFEKHPAQGAESSRFAVVVQKLDSDGYLCSTDVSPPELAGWLICYGPHGWHWEDANMPHGGTKLSSYLDGAMSEICQHFGHQPEAMPKR